MKSLIHTSKTHLSFWFWITITLTSSLHSSSFFFSHDIFNILIRVRSRVLMGINKIIHHIIFVVWIIVIWLLFFATWFFIFLFFIPIILFTFFIFFLHGFTRLNVLAIHLTIIVIFVLKVLLFYSRITRSSFFFRRFLHLIFISSYLFLCLSTIWSMRMVGHSHLHWVTRLLVLLLLLLKLHDFLLFCLLREFLLLIYLLITSLKIICIIQITVQNLVGVLFVLIWISKGVIILFDSGTLSIFQRFIKLA